MNVPTVSKRSDWLIRILPQLREGLLERKTKVYVVIANKKGLVKSAVMNPAYDSMFSMIDKLLTILALSLVGSDIHSVLVTYEADGETYHTVIEE